AARVAHAPPDGLTPQAQLDSIDGRVAELLARQRSCLEDQLLPALADNGIRLVGISDPSKQDRATLHDFFETQVFPVLTPLAVDRGHPFPYISNLSLSLAVDIRDPETGADLFARVKVPKSLPRWIPAGPPNHFVPLEQLIGANISALFPGVEIRGWYAFRITRYSDLELDIEDAEDLLASIEEQVFKRRFSEVVRVEVEERMPMHLRTLLLEELAGEDAVQRTQLTQAEDVVHRTRLTQRDVHETGALLELGDLMALTSLDIPELRDPPLVANAPPSLREPDAPIFEVLRERDVLVHHPFDSFDASVERFLEEAADDDDVLAIKMTLYRTSGDTDIVRALTRAAQYGKQVVVLVELQARFDEANNITWARTLESFGVHVAYGLARLKTHAKVVLVVRRESDGIRRYVHIGTGNYNVKTARVYTDIGLFTCSGPIGADVSDLFNVLTGFSRQRSYRKLLVAPGGMRDRFLDLIEREAEHARNGRGGRIIMKMNALVDAEAIEALYSASQAGVEIDLLVRGICCLRPGLDGISDRIRVVSIVGRFLEHSRLWYFANAGDASYYLGSADWMPRNFDRRVEAVVPIEDPALHPLLDALLASCLADNRQTWDLAADGHWTQRSPGGEGDRAIHRLLLRDSWGRNRQSDWSDPDLGGEPDDVQPRVFRSTDTSQHGAAALP
ncbi:MAG: polyphosphate kinase 1, partial [Gemmatimonadaceae bacterium]